jgi:hypothetical protein
MEMVWHTLGSIQTMTVYDSHKRNIEIIVIEFCVPMKLVRQIEIMFE